MSYRKKPDSKYQLPQKRRILESQFIKRTRKKYILGKQISKQTDEMKITPPASKLATEDGRSVGIGAFGIQTSYSQDDKTEMKFSRKGSNKVKRRKRPYV
jgi:hypothetical protein